MSDLERVIERQMDRHQPQDMPAFTSLQGRHREHRRKRVAGTIAASLAVAGAVGIAWPLGGGDVSRLSVASPPQTVQPGADRGGLDDAQETASGAPQVADPDGGPLPTVILRAPEAPSAGTRVLYMVSYRDPMAYRGAADDGALEKCLFLPGSSNYEESKGRPPMTTVLMSGEGPVAAFEQCIRGLPNLRVSADTLGASEDANRPSAPPL